MNDRRALAVLVGLHLAMVALVQPRGDFPLNDDWAFAQSVHWMLDEGRLRLSGWVAMNLVPQTLVGALAASIFGPSFEVLRHVTQVVAVGALFAAYAWFRAARIEVVPALVATLAVASFPGWPVLANSFMTDLYGLALCLPAAALFLKALDTPSRAVVACATVFSVAAVLERQVALCIPFAFMVASLWMQRPWSARGVFDAAWPFLAVLGAAGAFQAYLALGPGMPEGQRVAQVRVLPMAMKALTNEDGATVALFSNAAGIVGYLGLFSIGWLAWWGMPWAARRNRVLVLGAGLVLLALAFAFAWFPPYRANYLIDAVGIGPLLLHDSIRGIAPLDRSPGPFWRAVAVPAAFASAALVGMMAAAIARTWRDASSSSAQTVFMGVVVVGYLAPFVVTDYFDRYLVFVLPFLFALWARLSPCEPARWRQAAAIAWIVASIVLASVATRDYFSWNRARWDAIAMAERLGGRPDSIDGGFEYGGLAAYEKRGRQVPEGKSWYWVTDDRYVIAFSALPGYEEVATWKVARWLPRTPAEVKLLRRKS